MKYVTIKKFAEMSGYTQDAIRAKIKKGVWIKDRHWRRAGDGRIHIDVEGVTRWIENGPGTLSRR